MSSRFFRITILAIVVLLGAICLTACAGVATAPMATATKPAQPTATQATMASATSTPGKTTQTVIDSLGTQVEIPAEVQRVASLRSGITEIIAALGQTDKIVAVDEMVKAGSMYGEFITGVHPELKDRDCPVGGDVNLEELLRIDPDIVLHGGFGRIKQADAIKNQTDLPVVIAHFETLDAYMDDIRIVAKVVDAESRGEELIKYLQSKLDSVASKVKDVPADARVRVYYSGHDVYHVYTPETFEHAQIVAAGGTNVAADLKGWLPEVSAEQLMIWDPQAIVMLNGADVQAVLDDPKLAGISAVKEKRVYALPEASWDFSSPRALFCIEWLASKLYPDRLKGVDIAAEADDFYAKVYGVKYGGPSLTGDASPAPEPTKAPAVTAPSGGITVSGLAAKPGTISGDDLKAKAEKITAEHPKKGKTDYEGVRFSVILEMAQPKPEAKSMLMKAADGYQGEVQLPPLKSCADCMLALGDEDPNPDAVMPGLDMGAWVRDVVSIEFK